ncbi:MAG: hypothetical protein KJ971_08520 [Firmicutes bacterium]|nr:hypothetical protein [Bacillota bacterium]
MLKKNHKYIGIGLLVVFLAMNVISYFYLPDLLVMQIASFGSSPTTLPKTFGLSIILVVELLSVYYLFQSKEEQQQKKWLFVSVVLLILNTVVIVFNL